MLHVDDEMVVIFLDRYIRIFFYLSYLIIQEKAATVESWRLHHNAYTIA